uniref:Uncharacterized protein n=1 Tax=Agarophyton chilense TaxID=2510777 RepID=O49025_AGACH|nr:ORF3 [Agarophyton chilense]
MFLCYLIYLLLQIHLQILLSTSYRMCVKVKKILYFYYSQIIYDK